MQDVSEYYRYCPDQPKALISDAVCQGRRRTRYPQCQGCQFSDDEGDVKTPGGRRPAGIQEPNPIDSVFVGYNVRAKYPEVLNEEIAWRIGHATASYLRGALRGLDRSDPIATRMVVGRDNRRSSPALSAALVEGVRSTGADVADLGQIDSPQLYFAVNHLRACGGIHTTGSHAPAEYNGFKIVGQGARAVGLDTGLADICRIARNMVKHDTGLEGGLRTLDLTDEYRGFVRSRLQQLRSLKVVVDASNGMAGRWLPVIFDGVPGLELVYLNAECDGDFAHDPNPMAAEHLEQLGDQVRRAGADLGVCFDGDAGRLTVVDQNGEVVRSDTLTALLARSLLARSPGSTVVYDLRSSRAVAEEIKAAGGVPRRERVGQPFIKKALSESKAVFGGELSGRFYFRDNFCCDSAFLALVHLLNLVSSQAGTLGDLARPLQRYANSGQRFFENPEPDAAIRRLVGVYSGARVDYLDGITVQHEDWWFNVRGSITSAKPTLGLVVEADTTELMQQQLDELAGKLGTPVAAPTLQ